MTKFRTSINIYSVNLCEQTITIKVAYITSEPVCLKEEIGENRRVKIIIASETNTVNFCVNSNRVFIGYIFSSLCLFIVLC